MKIFLASAFKDNLLILQFEDTAELNQWLKEHREEHTPYFEKYRNTAPVAVVGAVMDSLDIQSTETIPPCPDHNVPMRKSGGKGDSYYCSKKTNGEFCKYRCKAGGVPYKVA